MASGDTREQNYLDIAANGSRADLPTETCCETRTQTLTREVAERVIGLDEEVQEMKNNPDVYDIVATYADLEAYDTQHMTDKDIIRVLADETHDGDSTYYRFDKQTGTFTYIGESKQYTDFVGTDGTSAGTSGLVPAPATTDAGKFLKADGTWDTAGGQSTLYTTPGVNTDGAMTQKATTELVYPDITNMPNAVKIGAVWTGRTPGTESVSLGPWATGETQHAIAIGANSQASGNTGPIAIGQAAKSAGTSSISIGYDAGVTNSNYYEGIAIGRAAKANARYTIALGSDSKATKQGEMNIGVGTNTKGYNSSPYRLISGVYDGQGLHDAATVAQGNTLSASAPTTATVGVLAQLYTDTTSMHTYQLTAIDTTDPNNPTYTWTQRW